MTVRRVVVDHVLFVVENLDASRRLYTAALSPLGYAELHVQEDGVSYGTDDLDDFVISRGSPVTTAAHVAFDAAGRDAVDAFFEAAMANGATARRARRLDAVLGAVLRRVRERPPCQQRRGRVARARACHRCTAPAGRALRLSASSR